MSDHPRFSEYLLEQEFVAFDTETTGIWAPVNRVVEIGAVKFRLGAIETERFQQLINPDRPMPEEVIAIHGITDEMVAGAPKVAEVLPMFSNFCGPDSILIAHNAPFDVSFIGCELNRAALTFGDNPVMDTVDICKRLYPGLRSYSLLSLSQHFELAESQEHRALADAELVRELFTIVADKFSAIKDSAGMSELISPINLGNWQTEEIELPDGFADLKRAVAERRRTRISYAAASGTPSRRVIRPNGIYSLGSKIYVNAWCERSQADRTFRLDRIAEFETLDD